jgi:carbamoyl-phosphate synthase large subunit
VKENNKKQKLIIAVTALNAIDSPGPGIAVIRSIRQCEEFDVRIIGLAYESLEPGIYMHDIVDKTYQIP